MGTCFVIQPFDGGAFDKRYEDVLVPAIQAAGLEPYRVDRDPRVNVPIEHIESGIRTSDACLADISTNNPNVWFKLGFAIASQKEVVLVCSRERESRFPFDVQHRSIILYSTESARDFEHLRDKVTSRLQAILSKEERLGRVASMPAIAEVEGLAQHEIVTLVAIAQNAEVPTGQVSAYTIRQDMQKAGFTRVAVTLAVAALLKKLMVEAFEERDQNGNPYIEYSLTDKGVEWLMQNQDRLVLRREKIPSAESADDEEEVPF